MHFYLIPITELVRIAQLNIGRNLDDVPRMVSPSRLIRIRPQ